MTTVLVGYATAHGSTRSIARRVAVDLEERGVTADVQALDAVKSTDGYDAFVIGSAVHDMAWLPEALDFTRGHRDELTGRPLWIFSVGMVAALRGPMKSIGPKEEQKVAGELLEQLRPRGHRLFSGVIEPQHLSRPGRMKMKAMGLRYGDYREWPVVDAWAEEIAGELVPS
ncbi:flavodoxin domain-containing protein [Streptomyces sp. NPDC047928]|uniref:flavodoxin domain-containing protein n=1 Tax=unclassified Streptomyces TaxID=2593676 RepID=UPI00371F5EA0